MSLQVATCIASTAGQPTFCGTQQWQPFIAEAASRTGVPQTWIHAVMAAESAGCAVTNGIPTTSRAGAMGLMQIRSKTWNDIRERFALGHDPYDPHDNIMAGTVHLRDLYERYGLPGFIAAYNAGDQRLQEYRLGGRSLPVETLEFIARVQRGLARQHAPTPWLARPDKQFLSTPFTAPRQIAKRRLSAAASTNNDIFVHLTHPGRHLNQPRAEPTDVQ